MENLQVYIYIHAYYFLEQEETYSVSQTCFWKEELFPFIVFGTWENSTWPLINKLIIN